MTNCYVRFVEMIIQNLSFYISVTERTITCEIVEAGMSQKWALS